MTEKVEVLLNENKEFKKSFEAFQEFQEKKFEEIISLIQQINLPKEINFSNPLLKPIEKGTQNIKTNVSVNIPNMNFVNKNDDQ